MNARTAALNGKNNSQEIKDQIVQTLVEAGGQVDYVEVMFLAFSLAVQIAFVHFIWQLSSQQSHHGRCC